MPNNKICGEYIVTTNTPVCVYQFAGNNRNAVTNVTDVYPTWSDLSNGVVDDRNVDFLTQKNLHIVAIRINAVGGEGLRTFSKNAAVFLMNFVGNDSGSGSIITPVYEISKFNEWQSINDIIRPYSKIKSEKFKIGFPFFIVDVDDYNINPAYKGQQVKFFVEMRIKTAGLALGDDSV